ncbi:hypothetical protein Tco_1154730 [Tanacetum coccineum]
MHVLLILTLLIDTSWKPILILTMAIMTLLIEVSILLALKQTRRPRSDRGKARHSVSSSSSHHQGTSSHQHDDDDDDDVETFRATSSTSLSPNGYFNSSTSPPPRVSPPPPTQENISIDITLTLLPITPLDVQFDTSSPSPPIFGHPIPWNLLVAHGDSCLCCIHNRDTSY